MFNNRGYAHDAVNQPKRRILHRPASDPYGAASGMATGAATDDYTDDLVKFGRRRIVDRCMTERGHVILNDPGRG